MIGTIEKIYDTIHHSDKFKKREFVITVSENPQYPESIKMELIQDKCDLLDNIAVGQLVDVQYNLKGRKWTNPNGEDVYFNTVQAWKIEPTQGMGDITPERDKNDAIASGEADDLPF